MGRVVSAFGSLLVVLATASLFAVASGCGAVGRAAGARRRGLILTAALVAAAAAVWIVLSPLVAMAVPLAVAVAVAVAFAARGAWRADDLTEYAAASDRARSEEPPWWPEFEHQFRRECRRYARARRG